MSLNSQSYQVEELLQKGTQKGTQKVCVWLGREMSSKEIISGIQNREKVTHHHTIRQTRLNVCF